MVQLQGVPIAATSLQNSRVSVRFVSLKSMEQYETFWRFWHGCSHEFWQGRNLRIFLQKTFEQIFWGCFTTESTVWHPKNDSARLQKSKKKLQSPSPIFFDLCDFFKEFFFLCLEFELGDELFHPLRQFLFQNGSWNLESRFSQVNKNILVLNSHLGGGFEMSFIFTPIWGRFPFWLIFFNGVETTNQPSITFWVSFGLNIVFVSMVVLFSSSNLGKNLNLFLTTSSKFVVQI